MQSGVTDITTAKNIARKLFLSYANGSQIEKQSLEKMLSDTYKIMVQIIKKLEQGFSSNNSRR